MKRILILVTSLDRGGIETMLMNYYRALDKKKFQFDFLVNREARGAYEEEIEALGGKIYRMCAMYPWNYARYKRELRGFLLSHPEYDVIHSHLEERSYWPLKIAQAAGAKVRIAHIHNYYPVSMDPKTIFRQWFRYGLRRRGITTHRLACSEVAGKWLFGTLGFEVVADAIDVNRFRFSQKARERVRAELGVPDGVRLVGQVGRLAPQKNPLFSVGLTGKKTVVVYVGKGKLEGDILRAVRSLGTEDRVRIVKPVGNIEDYYSAFDVLVMPSRYEGLGMVLVEAGAAGLPALASDKVPTEANVAGNVKFLPLQVGLWSHKIERLAVVNRAKFSAAGSKQIVEAGYEVAAAAKELERFYEELV